MHSGSEKIKSAKLYYYEATLEVCQKDYERRKDVSKTLEGKAQSNITVAGIFIAAIFAFIRDVNALNLNPVGKCVLVAAIVLLIASVLCSVCVFILTITRQPLTGAQLHNTVTDLVSRATAADIEKNLSVFKITFVSMQIEGWVKSVDSIARANNWKTFFLISAHVFLLFAMLAVGILTLGILSGGLRNLS